MTFILFPVLLTLTSCKETVAAFALRRSLVHLPVPLRLMLFVVSIVGLIAETVTGYMNAGCMRTARRLHCLQHTKCLCALENGKREGPRVVPSEMFLEMKPALNGRVLHQKIGVQSR